MIARLTTALLLAGTLATAHAASPESLAQKNGCFACHALGQKVLGPAYKDVAAKYAKDPAALARLSAKVKHGGGGVWGPMAMPGQPQLKDDEIKTLVEWILSLKA
jgi:cytochrome c